MNSIPNVALIVIARSSKFADVNKHNISIKELVKELEQRHFTQTLKNGNVQIFDKNKEEAIDHLSVFFFDQNDYLVKAEFYSNGVRF